MKRFSTILYYLRDQKGQMALYLFYNLMSIGFSLVSLTMLAPFLQILFGLDKDVPKTSPGTLTNFDLLDFLKYQLKQLIDTFGHSRALAVVCITVVLAILFKNFFLYMSYRVIIPLRNRIMTRFRADLYDKILRLPIGFFTEQRKGDIMSRMSNDMNEIEWSVIGTMEGLIREPLTILIFLGVLFYLSPLLSLFLLVLLPLTGFIIGRISRSLKKQSSVSQEQQGHLLSILDETLGGLRVIKAFNAEKLLRSRFF